MLIILQKRPPPLLVAIFLSTSANDHFTKQSQSFTSKLVLGTNVEMNGWKYGEYESFVEVLFFDREGSCLILKDPPTSAAVHIYLIKFADFC